ncbi:glycoside hydrolase superfamily [Jimgerdemannia flammicorona]|uniref:Glycoside hydrolase superfamily n=1 Tax=Jimgerdemannia flammicorona TaxID=994334 RepID=A0A433DE75_9FUNG|nr:glycoside hydrolase superfamily [Jimgerdemannia flammicorona]
MSQDLMEKLGQLVMVGFHGLVPSQDIVDLITNHNIGSVILFVRNIANTEQIRKLTIDLQQIAKDAGHARPLLIAVDQENGVVRRLGSSGTYLPGNMAQGAIDSTDISRKVANATARELLVLGLNYNLCPDLDVNNNPLNPVIGVRSFGEDPNLVGRLGVATIHGYQDSKVPASIKHFPGHGDTAVDSHIGLPVINKTMEELEHLELIPFRRAIAAANPASVMIAHIALPNIIKPSVEGENYPASISREIVFDLLRTKIGYEGIIITDCLEMNAVANTIGTEKGALKALHAGNDVAMICHTYSRQLGALELIKQAVSSGDLSQSEIEKSLERMEMLKDRYLSWETALPTHPIDPTTVIGCEAHQRLREISYDLSTTLVRNNANLVPLRPTSQEEIVVLVPHVSWSGAIDSEETPNPFQSLYDSVKRRHTKTVYIIYHDDAERPSMEDSQIAKAVENASFVIIATANGNLYPYQTRTVKMVLAFKKPTIGVAVVNPYDLMSFPELDTYLVTYEYTPPAHEAAVRVIFGEIEPKGKLPVTLVGLGEDEMADYKKKTRWLIEDYETARDFDDIVKLWNVTLGKEWPLAPVRIQWVLENGPHPHHFVVRRDGEAVGFAATFITTEHRSATKLGHLGLLLVDPAHQHQGIGTALHDHSMHYIRASSEEVTTIHLGTIYPRLFCGIPETHPESIRFFQNRGWNLDPEPVFDLIQDLGNYETPKYITDRMTKEKIHFSRITPDTLWELYAFESQNFPGWFSTYKHHAELGDFQDLLVGRDGSHTGPIIAATIIYTSRGSHERRSDIPWQHPSLFDDDSGGMACVGVAENQRGRGIGIGIVAYANEILKRRGVRKSYVDWVEIVRFYQKTGYNIWRGYRLGWWKV